jgi:thiosulfate/3-mercaptopyruvate sulfurtransferase
VLFEPAELATILGDPDVRVLDASWRAGATSDDLWPTDVERIEGAEFFDHEAISDHSHDLPLMAPSPDVFADYVGRLGIRRDHVVVIYDAEGLGSLAARAWWLFKLFGHPRALLLNGGLSAWRAARRPVVQGRPSPPPTESYLAEPDWMRLRDASAVSRELAIGVQLVDTRAADRYDGGHIPGALSLPAADLAPNGCIPPDADLRDKLGRLRLDQPITVYCGVAGSSPVLAASLECLGVTAAVYDGSWSEWSRLPETPKSQVTDQGSS